MKRLIAWAAAAAHVSGQPEAQQDDSERTQVFNSWLEGTIVLLAPSGEAATGILQERTAMILGVACTVFVTV